MTVATSEDEVLWVGLDLGTQSVTALAVSTSGRVVGSGSRPLVSPRDGDRHEQDPEQWWEALAGASRSALSGIAPECVRGWRPTRPRGRSCSSTVRVPPSESAFGMAVLAASAGRSTAEVAAAMVRVREVIAPRADRVQRFHEPYVRLVGELEDRGWLDASVTGMRARAA